MAIHGVNGDKQGKKKRKRDPNQKPSAYNEYMSKELKRVKGENPDMEHKMAFATIAAAWKTSDMNPKVPGSTAAIAKASTALAPAPVTTAAPVPEESPKKKQKKDKKKASPAAPAAPTPVSEDEAKKQKKAEKKRKKKEAAARAAAEAAN